MPNYVTIVDFNNILSNKERIELSTDGAETEDDDTVLTWALDSAESTINTFISTQVSVPMATPTDFIKYLTLSLAKYFLFVRRGHVPDDVMEDYDRIMNTGARRPGYLFLMMQGRLPVDGGDASSDIKFGSYPRVYGNTSAGAF